MSIIIITADEELIELASKLLVERLITLGPGLLPTDLMDTLLATILLENIAEGDLLLAVDMVCDEVFGIPPGPSKGVVSQ